MMNNSTIKRQTLDNGQKMTGKYGKIQTSKKGEKMDQTEKKVAVIIHSSSAAAGTAGASLAQMPLSDTAVITPIQIAMIISIGSVYDINLSGTAARGILMGAMASIVGRGISQILVGWIPGVGNIINASTAIAITESIGWYSSDVFKKQSQ